MRGFGLMALALGSSVALCAGCGGGATTAPASALVAGKVSVLNTFASETAAFSAAGFDVTCLNDGGSVETLEDGSFRISVPSGVVIRLKLAEPGDDDASLDEESAQDDATSDDGDDDSDRGDLDGAVIEIDSLEEGEICEIEIAFAGGDVVGCHIEFGDDHEGKDEPGAFHGEARLFPAEFGEDSPLRGEIEVGIEGGCARVELEAKGLTPSSGIEVLLVSPEGETESIFLAEVGAEGTLHLVLERCEGDPLPFGADSFAGLAGYGVVVQTLEGEQLLVGTLPMGAPEIPDEFEEEFEELEELLNDLLGGD